MEFECSKVPSAIYVMLCLLVCFYQTFSVLQEYLKYEVTSQLQLNIPDPLPAPDLTICARYTDIIDLKKLGEKNNISITRGYRIPDIRFVQQISTISDILKFTPREDGLLGNCIIRKPNNYSPQTESGDLCMKFFSASKFVTQEYVCYKFSATSLKELFDYGTLTSSLSWPGLFYMVIFKNFSWIEDVAVMKIAVHSTTELPYMSLGLGSLITSRRNTSNYNHITLTYKSVEVISLETPYVTNCRKELSDGRRYSKQDCYTECIVTLTKESLQEVPFSILIQEPLKMRTISSEQISNDSFSLSLSKIESGCNSQCQEIDCVFDYTMTYPSYQKSDELQFMVNAPNEPTLRIEFKEQISFNELIYFSMSLFSFWFGISVFTLNPASLIKRNKVKLGLTTTEVMSDEMVGTFCRHTRKNLMRGLKSELKFISDDIFSWVTAHDHSHTVIALKGSKCVDRGSMIRQRTPVEVTDLFLGTNQFDTSGYSSSFSHD